LHRDGEYLRPLTDVSANVIVGVAAVTIGWMAAKALA
jgi:hypothetical protein